VPSGADRFESTLLLHRDNKSQQKSTPHGRGILVEATNINRNQHNLTESAKVSKSQQNQAQSTSAVSKSQQKSSQIIRNHQKSSPVWTVVIKNHQ
jgi:hypothetical protein